MSIFAFTVLTKRDIWAVNTIKIWDVKIYQGQQTSGSIDENVVSWIRENYYICNRPVYWLSCNNHTSKKKKEQQQQQKPFWYVLQFWDPVFTTVRYCSSSCNAKAKKSCYFLLKQAPILINTKNYYQVRHPFATSLIAADLTRYCCRHTAPPSLTVEPADVHNTEQLLKRNLKRPVNLLLHQHRSIKQLL